MTIKSPRLKLRALLAVVAIIAVAIRCAQLVHTSYVNERLADFHGERGHGIIMHGDPCLGFESDKVKRGRMACPDGKAV